MTQMQLDERQLFEELKLLVRTHWVGFDAGEQVFQQLAQE